MLVCCMISITLNKCSKQQNHRVKHRSLNLRYLLWIVYLLSVCFFLFFSLSVFLFIFFSLCCLCLSFRISYKNADIKYQRFTIETIRHGVWYRVCVCVCMRLLSFIYKLKNFVIVVSYMIAELSLPSLLFSLLLNVPSYVLLIDRIHLELNIQVTNVSFYFSLHVLNSINVEAL